MTEAVEQIAPLKSPLHETHSRLGATMTERDGWSVPESYGDVLLEYAAVREGGAGVIDLSSRGRIQVSGTEAVQFLNGLVTNDMKTLAENSWMPAAFPNVQGRLIASVRVIRLKDEGTDKEASPTFLIDTEAATHERVLKTIERFTLAGDFRVNDVTSQTAQLSVQGKKATDIARSVLGEEAASLAINRATKVAQIRTGSSSDRVNAALPSDVPGNNDEVAAHPPSAATDEITNGVTVIRASHTAEDGFDLIVNSDQASGLWEALQNAGARPVGYDALDMLRIEAGLPRYGVDMDETNVVTETALDDAVSYTKGCYVGQEIIARIKYRGHVAKKLSGVIFEQAVKVEVGTVIKSSDDKEVGRITSVTDSPHLGRTIALAYLKYDYLAPGTEVKIMVGDEEISAQVTELPFVRGSWRKE
jgi:folate-binding protein YgfZ